MHRLVMAWGLVALVTGGLGVFGARTALAGGGCHSDVFRDEARTTVELKGNCFNPTVVRIGAGESITWANKDDVPHTVTGAANSFGDYDEFFRDQSVTFTFAESGVYPYVCILHPTMVGAVVVGDGSAGEGASFGIRPGGGAAASEASTTRSDISPRDAAGIVGVTLAAVVCVAGAAYALTRRSRRSRRSSGARGAETGIASGSGAESGV